ncbi:hypothetical protein A2U01_0090181, partial [Trifolium medium]|nr:hypothetical protein [Trifolium medium]
DLAGKQSETEETEKEKESEQIDQKKNENNKPRRNMENAGDGNRPAMETDDGSSHGADHQRKTATEGDAEPKLIAPPSCDAT